MSKKLIASLVVRSKTHAEWYAENPLLMPGDGAYSTDTRELRRGDGVHLWRDLPANTDGSVVGPHKDTHAPGARDAITDIELADGSSATARGLVNSIYPVLPAATHLDSVTHISNYAVNGNQPGRPNGFSKGILVTRNHGPMPIQEYVAINPVKIAVRSQLDGVWSAWKILVDETTVNAAVSTLTAEIATKADTVHTHTPAQAGAAPVVHTHTPDQCGAAPTAHTHTPGQVGLGNLPNAKSDAVNFDSTGTLATSKAVKTVNDSLAGKSDIGHTHTPAQAGAAPVVHTHTPDQCGAAPTAHTHTPEQAGAAPVVHTHTPAQVGCPTITKSAAAPTGGVDGDVHITYI